MEPQTEYGLKITVNQFHERFSIGSYMTCFRHFLNPYKPHNVVRRHCLVIYYTQSIFEYLLQTIQTILTECHMSFKKKGVTSLQQLTAYSLIECLLGYIGTFNITNFHLLQPFCRLTANYAFVLICFQIYNLHFGLYIHLWLIVSKLQLLIGHLQKKIINAAYNTF